MNGHADGHEKKQVRIHINREEYKSPTPTTGEALYDLGGIGKHQELFREVGGNAEDQFIPRDGASVELTKDEHFYSQKDFRLIVNAREKFWPEHRISYAQVIPLGYDQVPTGPDIVFTVAYRKGPHQNPKGTLAEGESVVVKDGMTFVVEHTNRS